MPLFRVWTLIYRMAATMPAGVVGSVLNDVPVKKKSSKKAKDE